MPLLRKIALFDGKLVKTCARWAHKNFMLARELQASFEKKAALEDKLNAFIKKKSLLDLLVSEWDEKSHKWGHITN